MSNRLPELIDPLVFAERRTDLAGKLQLSSFSRLLDLLLDSKGEVELELSFSKQGRHAFIDGWAKTTLSMQCQNCLEAVAVPIYAVIKLGLLSSLDQEDGLPPGYEPLLLEVEKILLREIVEDEILLALPAFPKHDFECVSFAGDAVIPEVVEEVKPDNPFAVLANYK